MTGAASGIGRAIALAFTREGASLMLSTHRNTEGARATAERIRAAGAGIGAFFTPTGYGTQLAEGKETRIINGRPHVLEYALQGDVALIKAHRADRWGNLVYRKAARNFGPIMATAARCTIAQVSAIVELGALDPEIIVTPGIFVHRLVIAGRAPTP